MYVFQEFLSFQLFLFYYLAMVDVDIFAFGEEESQTWSNIWYTKHVEKLYNVRKDNIEYHQGHVDCGLLSNTFKD